MDAIYGPLGLEPKQIRQLILHPGQYEDELSGDLRVESLDSEGKAVEYEALSYVWGKNSSEPDPPRLGLGSARLEITPNLDQALRHLRDEHQPRTFWVDAVCINQKNTHERNQQVAMMRTVYEKAARVVVWLGPATEHTSAVIRFFQQNHDSSRDVHWREPSILPFGPPGAAFAAMHDFFDSPWWKRTWTFQEAAVARDIVLHIGSMSLHWDLLASAHSSYDSHRNRWRCCDDDGVHELLGPMVNLEEIVEYRKCRSKLDVLDFISWNRHRDATDPRDKIIGFAGLGSAEMFDMALLDYGLPADKIYRRWTVHLIDKMQNLDIFSHILHADHETTSGWAASSAAAAKSIALPSWVPDWVQTPDYETLAVLQYQIRLLEHFNAAERTRPCLSVDETDDPKEITLCGTSVDTIAKVLDSTGQSFAPNAPTISTWRFDAGMEYDPGRPYVPRVGGTIFEAFWGAVFPGAETIMSDHRRPLYMKPTMREQILHDQWWWTECKHAYDSQYGDQPVPITSTTSLNGTDIIKSGIFRFTTGKRMFLTEQGYLGLAPQAAAEGDQVVVLLGGRMPFILRQANVGSTEPRKFELVGTCSVHGLMDGEAIEMVEDGDLELEDFILV
ncbi:hypothetical protein EG329_008322 [Mollisiaceae sp. DMI_Dod_QoI]|nr:hypothetical protein EG329_008322 [Helotiales sp. DMI_Dod_QoI]